MKSLNGYINESTYESANLEDLKKQLLKMDNGDRIHSLWAVREKYTDVTGKDRMVDYAMSIDKQKNNMYIICGTFGFKSHDLFMDALEASGVKKWYHFKDMAIRLGYEDMIKVLEAMPKFFDKYINEKHGIWHYLSFDRKDCEKECEKQARPFLITSLEDEIKGIEQGIKELEDKKAKLQELKQAQAADDKWEENK